MGGLPGPQRCCCHLLLDHLHCDGGRDGVLPDGIHGRGPPLEDLHERGCVGDLSRSGALLLHARVLGQIGSSPIVYRYIDWSITVPLQMVEFYLILSAVKPDLGQGMFWRLLIGTVVMLAAGYIGEARFINPWIGFIVGMCGWAFILFEIFAGEAGSVAGGDEAVSVHVKTSFNTMRLIVTAGWSIYPLGYFFGYLLGSVNDSTLNLVYNLADFVNKIAFCLAIW